MTLATGLEGRGQGAVNLALATGVPIRVEAGVFAAALTDERAGELASLPVATGQIAVEAQRRIGERRKSRPQSGQPSAEQGERGCDSSPAGGQ